jgi:hypothetical protein
MAYRMVKAALKAFILIRMIGTVLSIARIGSIEWISRSLIIAIKGAFVAMLWNLIKKNSANAGQKYFHSLLRGALAFLLLRYTKNGITQSSPISIIGALLFTLMNSKKDREEQDPRGKKSRIIDLDEFKVVDKEH